jgi:DNA-binding response OmpR family regulator
MSDSRERLHVLVLTADLALSRTFACLFDELGIEAHTRSASTSATEELSRAKYEGVLLDFDTVADARPVLTQVKQSRSNKNAIVLAVATEPSQAEVVLQDQAHFLFRRPIDSLALRTTLHTASDLMRTERRRYFRCSALLNIELRRSSGNLQAVTLNVSSNGVAISTPQPLQLGERVELTLSLPDGFGVHGSGVVIWDDKHGKSGLHFCCGSQEMRSRLDSWLDHQAELRRHSSVANS